MQTEKIWKDHLGVALKYCLLGLGLYFFGRVIRNNLYFPLIAPIEAADPGLYMGLRYLGHLVFAALLVAYFLMAPTYANSSVVYDAAFGVEGTVVALAVNGIAIAVFAILICRRKRAGKPGPLEISAQ